MSGLNLIPVAIILLAGVTVFAHVLRFPDRPWTAAEGRRIKSSIVAMAFWMVASRWLASESFHPCQVDARLFAMRNNGAGAGFLDCTPQMLSAGAASAAFFFWLWAPIALLALLCVRHLVRIAAAGKKRVQ
jgi:hypothetical protein